MSLKPVKITRHMTILYNTYNNTCNSIPKPIDTHFILVTLLKSKDLC